MREGFIEKIYAGWLAKIIGIRLGAPVESWTYEKIRAVYGQVDGYLVDYKDFAADDDSNGPLFFLRALEEGGSRRVRRGEEERKYELESQDVAEALLNYAPFEHGFFWWGGYGTSTEHTAYLNLAGGMEAPRSGSVEQNGSTVAEQIGGQIFIDTWGRVAPGRPEEAAGYAKEAASVTHGGNGVYGGMFVAACISQAFVESDIRKLIAKGLSVIPQDCEYARVVRAVENFYEQKRDDWEACFRYIQENFGYDRYPGNCHIIPNAAVMILSLLYGEGDFDRTLNICNMCGWDTDCNVGNVATIMGVCGGLEAIDERKWRKPVHDFLACSSVVGSPNIMDIPFGASYIANLAYQICGEQPPQPWKRLWEQRMDSCHFEFPGSTHSMRARMKNGRSEGEPEREFDLRGTEEMAFTGMRSLKTVVKPVQEGEAFLVYKKTYYRPADFHDSRYDPAFSPILYPGQSLHAAVCAGRMERGMKARLYVRGGNGRKEYFGEWQELEPGRWENLTWKIPKMDGEVLEEAGVCFLAGEREHGDDCCVYLDDLYWEGAPSYRLDPAKERVEVWPGLHREVSQFTRQKGLLYLEDGRIHLSCSDLGEAYTGGWNWKDYRVSCRVTAHTGSWHLIQARVQGAMRSYAFGLLPDGEIALLKKDGKDAVLCRERYDWEPGKEYTLFMDVKGAQIRGGIADGPELTYTDANGPYLYGSIGLAVRDGSHLSCGEIVVEGD